VSRQAPGYTLRAVPATIYLALALDLASVIASVVARVVMGSEPSSESIEASTRYHLLSSACSFAGTLLFSLGLLELARGVAGAPRTLARVAAALFLVTTAAGLGYALVDLKSFGDLEAWRAAHQWIGRSVALVSIAAVVLLVIAADGFRRVPVAAIGLCVLLATGRFIPFIDELIYEPLASHPTMHYLYSIARMVAFIACYAFVAGAIAASARGIEDPTGAATGMRLARGALIARVIAAIVLAFLPLGVRSPGTFKLVLFATPVLACATLIVVVIGISKIAASRLDGMPRIRLAVGAAAIAWWCGIQIQQVLGLVRSLEHGSYGRFAEGLQLFSIAGPIAATLGIALAGSAIASFAANRGDASLASAASSGTYTFAALSLGSLAVAHIPPTSLTQAVMLVLFAASLSIASLVVIARLFGRAADELLGSPLPPARIV
jgi:hypothetical protein